MSGVVCVNVVEVVLSEHASESFGSLKCGDFPRSRYSVIGTACDFIRLQNACLLDISISRACFTFLDFFYYIVYNWEN